MQEEDIKDTKGALGQDYPPCKILIDEEGHWYYEGISPIRDDFVKMFYEHLDLIENNVYVIKLYGDICKVDVKDTAYVVWGVDYSDDSRVMLTLSDWSKEELNPESVWIGNNNVLYCRVKQGKFPCRFARKAFYQISGLLFEENNRFYLRIKGFLYPIATK